MIREFYCAGNWKMNKNPEQAEQFAQALKAAAPTATRSQLVVFPPALVAYQVAAVLNDTGIGWGAQNCYFTSKGAFTGENSPQVLAEMGARFCLVGHSERRQIFGELDEQVALKVEGAQKHGLTPILCVGETLDDRRWNRTQEVILRQLRMALHSTDVSKPIWIAYEPVWAIGTGEVATPSQVEEVHESLRKALSEWNTSAGESTPILYGGSVKVDNARTLASLKNVNGFLIGGASLDVQEFIKIHQTSIEARQ